MQTTKALVWGSGGKAPESWNSFWTFNASCKFDCFLIFGDAKNHSFQQSAWSKIILLDFSKIIFSLSFPWQHKFLDIFQFSLTCRNPDMQNGLELNPDKSEPLVVGTLSQLNAMPTQSSMAVTGTNLPAADYMKVLGLVLVLSFGCHATSMAERATSMLTPSDTSNIYWPGTRPGVQPHTVSTGLLQCCVARWPAG